jgi:hypothetical protein
VRSDIDTQLYGAFPGFGAGFALMALTRINSTRSNALVFGLALFTGAAGSAIGASVYRARTGMWGDSTAHAWHKFARFREITKLVKVRDQLDARGLPKPQAE